MPFALGVFPGAALDLDFNGQVLIGSWFDETFFSLLADLDFSFNPKPLGEWTIAPVLTLGYERILDDPQVEGVATLYGFTVRQQSAYESHDLMKASVGLSAKQGAFTVKGRVRAGWFPRRRTVLA